MSPSMRQAHAGSLEMRLAQAVVVPNSDRAIAHLLSSRKKWQGEDDELVLRAMGYDASSGRTMSGPHVLGSLSMASAAFQ